MGHAENKFKLNSPETLDISLNGAQARYFSYTTIPYSHSEWKDFSEKENIEYSETEKRLGSLGGSACAHSPLCVIVVPFLIADAVKHYSNKERRLEITFQINGDSASINYHKGSGAFLNANFPERVETHYFPKLGYGFIYFESNKNEIADKIIKEMFMDSPSLSESDKQERIETLLDFDSSVALKLLSANNFRGKNRSTLIQRYCIVATENDHLATLTKIVNSIDSESRDAILNCLSYNQMSEQHTALYQPLIQSSWEELCLATLATDNKLVTAFSRVINVERKTNSEIDIECDNQDIVVLRKLLRRRETLSKADWLQILSNRAMNNFAQSNALDTQRNSKNSLLAKLEHSLVNTQSLSNRALELAFDFSDNQIDKLLADYYFGDFHETIKLPLLGSNDSDIYQKAFTLQKIIEFNPTRQSHWKNRLKTEDQKNWKRHHLALAIAVEANFSEATLNKLMKSDEDFIIPKGWQDISEKLDNNKDCSVQLLLLAMQLSGKKNNEIEALFYAINPKSDSDLLLEKAKRFF